MSWEVTSLIFLSWRTRKETCRQFKPGNFIRFWFISIIEFVNIRTWSDPWKQYKNENEAKVKKVLSDKSLVESIKSVMKSSSTLDPVKENPSYLLGRTHKDLHSSLRPVEAGFDMLRRLAEVEEALVGKILSYCSTATLYSLRLVSKLWLDLATTWFMDRHNQIGKNWSLGVRAW